jgi:hypothetical protein
MPWHAASEDGKIYKYQYHPNGDKSQPLRAAPSALNTVIVPNVTLPEVCSPSSLSGPKPAFPVLFISCPLIFHGHFSLGLFFLELLTDSRHLIGPSREVQQVRQGGVGLLNIELSPFKRRCESNMPF